MLLRSVLRTIRTTLVRYFAILAIIALGVGFFAGLRVTEASMLKTADGYLSDLRLYDYRLVSTLGFTDDDVAAFRDLSGIGGAWGSVSRDVLYKKEDGTNGVLHAHTLLDGVNGLDLVAGRLPTSPDECVLDAKFAGEDRIGTHLLLSEENTDETKQVFGAQSYTVVGIANASAYINFERGGTSLSNGTVSGFVYLPPEAFRTEGVYTEIYLTLTERHTIYSDEETAALDAVREVVEACLRDRADARYRGIRADAEAQLAAAEAALSAAPPTLPAETIRALEERIAEGREALAALTEPTVYALDRLSNVGYASLQNDTAIVSGVAKVFPFFFFLVAALVCITTMTRMVGEGRTQNGTLKALGYGSGAILSQYLLYAGSASLFGCIIGFLLGSRLLPLVLWQVYGIMYSIHRPAAFVLNWGLFAACTAAFLSAALGATVFVCYRDLRETAAQLIRPKTPTAGKKILLERIPALWNRLRFLHKVSLRNIFRYKGRMLMTVLGIGGCTALLLTGFGIRDSIRPVVENQYNKIQLFDASVSFFGGLDEEARATFLEKSGDAAKETVFLYTENASALVGTGETDISLVAADGGLGNFVDLHRGKTPVAYPGDGEVAVNYRFADEAGLAVGDTLTLRDGAGHTLTLRISGVFDNYISDYAYVTGVTLAEGFGEPPLPNTAYVLFPDGADAGASGAVLRGIDGVANVLLSEEMKTRVGSILDSLDYIVLIVLVCAGALSFTVLYNLTNITIAERTRELATIKVLGFYPGEQNSYVFRENIVLTAMSAVIGLPLGIALHRYVMAQIRIRSIYFGHALSPWSFLIAVAITFVFTLLVDLTLIGKIRRINMAEALKAIE